MEQEYKNQKQYSGKMQGAPPVFIQNNHFMDNNRIGKQMSVTLPQNKKLQQQQN